MLRAPSARHTLAQLLGCAFLACSCGSTQRNGSTQDTGSGVSNTVAAASNTSAAGGAASGGNDGGNLIDYRCELGTMYFDEEPFPYETGSISSQEFDCAGRCQDGTCPDACPLDEDTMRYESLADGIHVLTDLDNGWRYECELFTSWQESITMTPKSSPTRTEMIL